MCLKGLKDMIIETSRKRPIRYTRSLFHFDGNLNDEISSNIWSVHSGAAYPKVYTSTYKFGTGCVLCDSPAGSGLYTHLIYNGEITSVLDVTKDFTFDAWIYNVTNTGWIVAAYETTSSAQNPNIGFFITHTAVGIRYQIDGALSTLSASYAHTGDWMHFAYTRNGSNNYIFYNGVLLTQNTTSTFDAPNYLRVAECQYGGANANIYFLDECRISKVARWTSNFTPPTTPYVID